ncbi:MAG: hypothetical protein LBK95_03215 [Bifidobacteriaceae bacterium]|jgi:ABC-2 type transport system permease protein|nr:hypothetical protein [Bifidobacteriaceae bacterium]
MIESPSRAVHWFRGARAWLRVEAVATASFRAQLFVSLLGWVVPFAFMALWNTAAAGSGVMTPGQTTAYYLVQLVTTSLSVTTALIFELGYLVYTGDFAIYLVMPFPAVAALLARPVIRNLLQSVPLVLVVPLLAWAMRADFTSDPLVWLAAFALYLLGTVAALLTAAVYALAALWFGKNDGLLSLFAGISWVLGGFIAPSSFLPDWVAWTMRLSPLWAGQGGFGDLLSGRSRPPGGCSPSTPPGSRCSSRCCVGPGPRLWPGSRRWGNEARRRGSPQPQAGGPAAFLARPAGVVAHLAQGRRIVQRQRRDRHPGHLGVAVLRHRPGPGGRSLPGRGRRLDPIEAAVPPGRLVLDGRRHLGLSQ